MGELNRNRLPNTLSYFDSEDVPLTGPGKWKTGPCHFHDGSDSLRVNTQSGGWVCMACGAKGGDVLSYAMQRHGLGFVEAARQLGAYVEGPNPPRTTKPTTLPPREAMEVIADHLATVWIVVSDVAQGVIPNDADWQRFNQCTGRIEALVMEYRA